MTIRLIWPKPSGLVAFGSGPYRLVGRVFRFLYIIYMRIRVNRNGVNGKITKVFSRQGIPPRAIRFMTGPI